MSAVYDIVTPWLAIYTLAEICRLARIHPNHMSNLLAGRCNPSRKLLYRIEFAISRLRTRQTEGSLVMTALYRLALWQSSIFLGLDPAVVQLMDPLSKQAANKEWRDASNARWLAWYLLNAGCNIPQAEVARAVGVSKQAVWLGVRAIEEKRDDPALEAWLSQMEFILEGKKRN